MSNSAGRDKPLTAKELAHDRTALAPGDCHALSPLVRRVVAPNASPFTFTGTCTYIVGAGDVTVIDPGPENADHLAALLAATKGERIARILVTHTHRDHSPGAHALKAATGARLGGCAPHAPIMHDPSGREDTSHDLTYAPDFEMRDGDALEGDGYTLTAVHTPGHASNHLCFALREENALFSGDQVLAWSTTVVAPPDGNMGEYMRSLEQLAARSDALYWPGHGAPVLAPQRYVRALASHRRQRERAIVERIATGDSTVSAIVDSAYASLNPKLRNAAALSVLAHLEDLLERGLIVSDHEAATLGAHYKIA
jgi:glyoxylase-like metal-dependent hydrolase (beta-lactamase superfamily II)